FTTALVNSGRMSAATTLAPAALRVRQTASPSPRPPPVTNATFPFNSCITPCPPSSLACLLCHGTAVAGPAVCSRALLTAGLPGVGGRRPCAARGTVRQQTFFNQSAQQMDQEEMHFLNVWQVGGRHGEGDVRELAQLTAISAEEGDTA